MVPDVPAELSSYISDGTQLTDKFLVFYAPNDLAYKLMTSCELSINEPMETVDYSIIHIYLHPDPYESAPPQEEDEVEIEDIGVILPVEIPPDYDIGFDNTVVYTITIEPTLQLTAPETTVTLQPHLVYEEPQESEEVSIRPNAPENTLGVTDPVSITWVVSEPVEDYAIVAQDNEPLKVDRVVTPVVISQPAIEENEITYTITFEDNEPSDTEIIYIEPTEDTENQEYSEKAEQSRLETVVSDLRFYTALILAINALGVVLFMWFYRKKWS
jgi:hypothetical protein